MIRAELPDRIQIPPDPHREFALGLLKEEKVACVPGGAFGESGQLFVRCCFATAFDQIRIAMDRMARYVERTRKG